MKRQSPGDASKSSDESAKLGVDFGWRTHGAITDWTARVDSKAAIVLSLGGALIGFFVSLSASGRVLAHLVGWRHIVEDVGVCITAVGVFLAGLVVAPRLNRRKSKETWRNNFLYFGHLRHWEPGDLRKHLAGLTKDDELSVLSKQLVATSKIAWKKHSMLQWSIAAIAVGVIFVAVSGSWPR